MAGEIFNPEDFFSTDQQSVDADLAKVLEREDEIRRLEILHAREQAEASPLITGGSALVDRTGRPVDPTSEVGLAMAADREGLGPETKLSGPATQGPPSVDPNSPTFVTQQQSPAERPESMLAGLGRTPSSSGITEALSAVSGTADRYRQAALEGGKTIADRYEAAKAAKRALADETAMAAARQAGILTQGLEAAAIVEADFAKRRQSALERSQLAMDAYQESLRENMKQEPVEGWGFGRRLGAGIAMALGAIGSAYTGGQNQALQIIKLGIEREAMNHKRRAAQRAEKTGAQRTIYSLAKDHYNDVESQALAAKAAQYGLIKKKIELEAAKSSSSLVKVKAAEAIAALDAEQQKSIQELNQNQIKNEFVMRQGVLEGEKTKFGVESAKLAQRQSKIDKLKAIKAAQEAGDPLAVIGTKRLPGFTPSSKMREAATTIKTSFDEAAPLFDELIEKVDTEGFAAPGTDASEDMKQLSNDLNNAMRRMNMAGANFTDSERELQGIISNPGGINLALQKLKTARRNFKRRAYVEMKNRGYLLPGPEIEKQSKQRSKE